MLFFLLFAITFGILFQNDYNIFVIAENNSSWMISTNNLKKEGNYSRAIFLYDKALRIDKNYINALDGKGLGIN